MNLANFEILNPDKNGLTEADGAITIATNCGWMWGKGNSCTNLLLSPTRLKEATVEITIDLLPIQNGEQVGLVLFIDSDNYIKLVREMVDDKHVVVLAKELNGEPNVELLLPFESAQAGLKLTISPDTLTAFWRSADTEEFQQQAFPNWFPPNANFRPGIVAHGNTPDHHATVQAFSVNGQAH